MALGSYYHGKYYGVDFTNFGLDMYKTFNAQTKKSIWLRTFYGFGSFLAALLSIKLMPVSVSVAITMTAVFVTALLGWVIAGETLSKDELYTIFGGFFGVVMLTNPSMFSSAADEQLR